MSYDTDTLLKTTDIDGDIATTIWLDPSINGVTITSMITEGDIDGPMNIASIPDASIPELIQALQTYMESQHDPR